MNKQFNSIPLDGAKGEQSDAAQVTKSSQPIGNTHVSSIVPLSYEEQCRLFDERFGRLDGSSILSHEEYVKHRDFLVGSGYFAFLNSQSSC